jgi:hypothetical protein
MRYWRPAWGEKESRRAFGCSYVHSRHIVVPRKVIQFNKIQVRKIDHRRRKRRPKRPGPDKGCRRGKGNFQKSRDRRKKQRKMGPPRNVVDVVVEGTREARCILSVCGLFVRAKREIYACVFT